MQAQTGWIVRSEAGHDSGSIFLVLGKSDEYLLLTDGKTRKQAKPKRKKEKHVTVLNTGNYQNPIMNKMLEGKAVSNHEIVCLLTAYRNEMEV